MARVLLLSTPIFGHVQPMVSIGRGLLARGHRVTLLTGSAFSASGTAAGLDVRTLPPSVDDTTLHDARGERRPRTRVAAGRHDILRMFVRPLPGQYAAVAAELRRTAYDAVIAESAFLGALPLLLGHRPAPDLPVLGVSTTPLSVTSVDCAPFGAGMAPGSSAFTRMRNRQIDWLLRHGPLRPIRLELDRALAAVGAGPCPVGYFDLATLYDLTFHLSVAGLEYPRRELGEQIRFVGPLPPRLEPTPRRPSWWAELTGPRPVVHVTQGTLDNHDLGKLLAPAVLGLAGEPVLVVAATGGRPVADLVDACGGRLPDNVRVAEFLPYNELLPHVDAVVTNGGYGGVQLALAHGCPLVVAGATEDKPEVAARVAWTGAGLDLRTGRPSPRRIRAAVRAVLTRPSFGEAAVRLQRETAALPDPVRTIADALEARLPGRPIGPDRLDRARELDASHELDAVRRT